MAVRGRINRHLLPHSLSFSPRVPRNKFIKSEIYEMVLIEGQFGAANNKMKNEYLEGGQLRRRRGGTPNKDEEDVESFSLLLLYLTPYPTSCCVIPFWVLLDAGRGPESFYFPCPMSSFPLHSGCGDWRMSVGISP